MSSVWGDFWVDKDGNWVGVSFSNVVNIFNKMDWSLINFIPFKMIQQFNFSTKNSEDTLFLLLFSRNCWW